MAIDKNSKAYQGLLNKGYTDAEITQMYNSVTSGQNAKQVVADMNTQKSRATPNYENQGAGNYVYNEKTGYYENTSKPTQSTPTTTEVKQETPVKQQETAGSTVSEIKQTGAMKPLSQEYYNQTSDNALEVIKNNLNNYKQSNPEYFTDYDSYKKNFSYDARTQEQKDVLDNFYNNYQKGLTLSSTPVNDLYTQYKDGQISLSDLELLKGNNPTKYAELQNQINKASILTAYDDTTPTENMNFQDIAYQMIASSLNMMKSGDYGASQYFSQLEEKMNSPEMLELQDKTTEINEQYKNIEDQIASIGKDVEKEYEGTGATKSKINAIIADRTYDLQQQLRTLGNEYDKYATQYNNRATQYQNEFQLQLQEYQVNMQARNQQMQELGFAMDLMNFETNEQKTQREWDYWVKQQEYTNGNINSKDYDTRYKAALKSVQNLLSQYEGIPMQRSAEQMAQDVLKAIDNGSDLGTELTKINKQIQGKPEYKKLYNATFGGSQGFGQTISIGGTDYVEYNGKLYTASDFNKQFGGGANYTVVSPDVLKTYSDGRAGTFGSFMANSKYNDGNYIGQCGKFVNDYLQSIGAGRPFGKETIDVREKWVNSDEGKVGTIALFDYNHYIDGKNYGHVGIVISAPDKNGDFWVKDANFDTKNPGVIMTRKVNLKDASLKGFIDPSLDQNGNRVSAGTSSTLTSDSNGTTTTSTITVGNLTPTQFDNYVKQYIDGEVNYSEVKAAFGDDGLAKVTERAAQLKEGGYEKSTKITDATKQANMEEKLRKEYDKAVEDSTATINWVKKMDDAYAQVDKNKNAASQALVIAYNKILDEGSVVREGEYARTAEGQSLIKRMTAKAEQITKGGAGIGKSELKSLVDMAHQFSNNASNYQKQVAERTKVSIDKYGLTPEAILPLDMINQVYGTDTNTSPTSWKDGLNKSSDVFKLTTNIGGSRLPANFFQK